MISRYAIVACTIAAIVQAGWSAVFTIKIDTGAVLLRQSTAAFWTPIKDSAAIGINDSLFMDDKYSATLKMGKGTKLALKGETRLSIQGSDTSLAIHLELGQVFLNRDEGPDVKSIKIIAQGCAISPLGTAAAVKMTKAREPSVAVVRGKMRMESPTGEAIDVGPGNFGTYSPANGSFKQGKIPPEAIASLEKWSGVTLDVASAGAPASQKPDSLKSMSDTPPANANASSPAAALATPSPASVPAASAATPQTSAQTTTPPAAPPTPGAAAAAGEEKSATPPVEEKKAETPTGISWEISAASVTVDGKQWMRLAISPDIPIWKFGLGLDIECFLDDKGNFSQKGWEFDKKNWQTSVARKLKYVRFGHEQDPLFVKVGGLSNVTLGYGFIVDRFTNLLHYPDDKLLGAQLYLNDLGPVGITLQTMSPDVMEFKNGDGGIIAGRLAFAPLKPMKIPLISSLSIGATYATDLNGYAGAKKWSFSGLPWDKNNNHKYDLDAAYRIADSNLVRQAASKGLIDTTGTVYAKPDTTFRDSTRRYSLLGADIGMPIVKTGLIGIDVYGQGAVVADSKMFKSTNTGWGFGAPGVKVSAVKGMIFGQVEYRHVHGKFTPGYFSTYFLDERLRRYPGPATKDSLLPSVDLDGIFGLAGVNFLNLLTADASYQYMAGSNNELDQRFEARGNIGEAILKRIPKISKAEMYVYKTNINRTVVVYTPKGKIFLKNGKPIYDDFFEQTPTLYWGYRIGVEIAKGASLIWDTRYGYQWGSSFRLEPNNNISIGTAITF
jgi:hypothetical protein